MIFKATANYGSWIHGLQKSFPYRSWHRERHLKLEFRTGSILSGGVLMPSSRRCTLGERHACNPTHLLRLIHPTPSLSRCWRVYVCQTEHNRARIYPWHHVTGKNNEKMEGLCLFWLEGLCLVSELQVMTLEWFFFSSFILGLLSLPGICSKFENLSLILQLCLAEWKSYWEVSFKFILK